MCKNWNLLRLFFGACVPCRRMQYIFKKCKWQKLWLFHKSFSTLIFRQPHFRWYLGYLPPFGHQKFWPKVCCSAVHFLKRRSQDKHFLSPLNKKLQNWYTSKYPQIHKRALYRMHFPWYTGAKKKAAQKQYLMLRTCMKNRICNRWDNWRAYGPELLL